MIAKSIWLILPTFNEADNIEALVKAAFDALDQAATDDFVICIVDDNSPDGTGIIANRLADQYDDVCVIHRPGKNGLGRAYVAGFERALAAGARYIMQMDADFSHDPAQLATLLTTAVEGADLVLGSRYVAGGEVENWGYLRRLVSRAGCAYARYVLALPIRDLTGGYKCFRADTLRAIDFGSVRSQGYAFQVELTYRAFKHGSRVVELPITFRERRKGHSKMSSRIAFEAVWLVPALRWSQRSR